MEDSKKDAVRKLQTCSRCAEFKMVNVKTQRCDTCEDAALWDWTFPVIIDDDLFNGGNLDD
jgi:hypothetical protein